MAVSANAFSNWPAIPPHSSSSPTKDLACSIRRSVQRAYRLSASCHRCRHATVIALAKSRGRLVREYRALHRASTFLTAARFCSANTLGQRVVWGSMQYREFTAFAEAASRCASVKRGPNPNRTNEPHTFASGPFIRAEAATLTADFGSTARWYSAVCAKD